MKRINSYVEKVKRDQFRIWEPGKPPLTALDFELTERCNNNCIHCYINQPVDHEDSIKKELSTQEIKNIINDAEGLGCLTIKFTGGEPLLREDFEDIYIHTRRLGIKVILFTNATLITPRIASLFAKLPPLEKIEISFYGLQKSSYEAVSRTPGSYEAACRGIKLLLENKVPFGIKSVLLPPTIQEIDEFERWASDLSSADQKLLYTLSLNFRCRRDSEGKNTQIKKLRLTPEETLTFLKRNQDTFSSITWQFCAKFMRAGGRRLFTCGAGVRGGSIDAYGQFQLCLLLRHPETVYNLRNGNLREAVTEFSPDIRTCETLNPEYMARCARCFLKGLCEQCPGKSWIEHGSLDTPVEYLCNVAHAKARYLGLIGDSENAWEVDDGNDRVKQQAANIRSSEDAISVHQNILNDR